MTSLSSIVESIPLLTCKRRWKATNGSVNVATSEGKYRLHETFEPFLPVHRGMGWLLQGTSSSHRQDTREKGDHCIANSDA